MAIYKYHPDKVNVLVSYAGANKSVYGLSQDGFVTVEFDDDKITKTIGVSGEGLYNISASKAGSITLTFLQGSPWLDMFKQKSASEETFYIEVNDSNEYSSKGKFICEKAMVRQTPVYSYGAEASDVEVVIDCIKLEVK